MRKIKYYIGAAMGLILSLSSCIKEDMVNCPASLLVKFTYETTNKNWDESELKKATVFIFDEDDNFIASWSPEEAPVLNKVYETNIDIRSGYYNFVTWTNIGAPYLISPDLTNSATTKTTRSQTQLKLYVPTTRSVDAATGTLPLLMFGRYNGKLEASNENLVEIPLVQNTNIIRVTVNGFPRTDDLYQFVIADNNGNYGFDNHIVEGDAFSYITHETYPIYSNVLTTSMTILKLEANHHTPTLTITDRVTNEQLFPSDAWKNNNLIELIKSAYPNNDFEKNHEYDILIFFNAVDGSIQLSINGYLVRSNEGELVP